MKQSGDPPQQEVLPCVERIPASAALLRELLRSIDVKDPHDTARRLKKAGFSISPDAKRSSAPNTQRLTNPKFVEGQSSGRLPTTHEGAVSKQRMFRGKLGSKSYFEYASCYYGPPEKNTSPSGRMLADLLTNLSKRSTSWAKRIIAAGAAMLIGSTPATEVTSPPAIPEKIVTGSIQKPAARRKHQRQQSTVKSTEPNVLEDLIDFVVESVKRAAQPPNN